jgi:hypothetical protein
LPIEAGLGLQHAAGHELAEDEAARRVALQEFDRLGIAHAEAVEERGHGVAAQDALLGDEARRLIGRRDHLGKVERLANQGQRHIDCRGAGNDAEGRDDRQRRQQKHQRTENCPAGKAGQAEALR